MKKYIKTAEVSRNSPLQVASLEGELRRIEEELTLTHVGTEGNELADR